ncbi:hypothetical protein QBC36DRAFT_80500 [Triangularia setosa]|uniref:Uncharacterized protein n=1 Tax=Triangularia setosa TaxID=2587417 RepID=A0AAN6WCZ4_9PEZI|nr:hypothetical protein QBC36DRAFT_80500 [Podospora setosa]
MEVLGVQSEALDQTATTELLDLEEGELPEGGSEESELGHLAVSMSDIRVVKVSPREGGRSPEYYNFAYRHNRESPDRQPRRDYHQPHSRESRQDYHRSLSRKSRRGYRGAPSRIARSSYRGSPGPEPRHDYRRFRSREPRRAYRKSPSREPRAHHHRLSSRPPRRDYRESREPDDGFTSQHYQRLRSPDSLARQNQRPGSPYDMTRGSFRGETRNHDEKPRGTEQDGVSQDHKRPTRYLVPTTNTVY